MAIEPHNQDADDVLPVEHLQVLRLEPDDIIVMSWPEHLTAAEADQMHSLLKSAFPRNRSLIIDSDGQIGAIRPARIDGCECGGTGVIETVYQSPFGGPPERTQDRCPDHSDGDESG